MLWHCPVPIIAKIAATTFTCIGSVCICIRSRATIDLHWQSTGMRFIAKDFVCEGQLASGSYYSPLVIVLAIRDSAGKIHRVPVWHDSVDAWDYSWLLIRLKTTMPQALL